MSTRGRCGADYILPRDEGRSDGAIAEVLTVAAGGLAAKSKVAAGAMAAKLVAVTVAI